MAILYAGVDFYPNAVGRDRHVYQNSVNDLSYVGGLPYQSVLDVFRGGCRCNKPGRRPKSVHRRNFEQIRARTTRREPGKFPVALLLALILSERCRIFAHSASIFL